MNANLTNKKGLFYKEEDIKEELKCFACKLTYDDPCILPCGDSVCYGCVVENSEVNNNNNNNNVNRIKEIVENFKCPVCLEIFLTLNPFLLPRNKVLNNLLNKKPEEIYRNQSVEQLKSILTEIELILHDFQPTLQQPAAQIEQYCHSLEIDVDLKVEQEIRLLRKQQEELRKKIDQFKLNALKHVSVTNENEEIATKIEEYSNHVNETSEFVERTYNYLKEYHFDDQQCQTAIQSAKENLQKLRENFQTYSEKYLLNKEDIQKLFTNELFVKSSSLKLANLAQRTLQTNSIDDLPEFTRKSLIQTEIPIDQTICSIEVINDEKAFLVCSKHNVYFANIVNISNGVLLHQSKISENVYVSNGFRSLIFDFDEMQLPTVCAQHFNGHNNYLLGVMYQFEPSLQEYNSIYLDNIVQVLGFASDQKKLYFLLRSIIHEIYLLVYTSQFIQLNSTETRQIREQNGSFYFSSEITQFKVRSGRFYLLDKQRIKVMNEQTGLVEQEFTMYCYDFDFFNQSLILACAKQSHKLYLIDLSGQIFKEIELGERELDLYERKCFTNNRLIAYNIYNNNHLLILS